jgi:hypothetical protein
MMRYERIRHILEVGAAGCLVLEGILTYWLRFLLSTPTGYYPEPKHLE